MSPRRPASWEVPTWPWYDRPSFDDGTEWEPPQPAPLDVDMDDEPAGTLLGPDGEPLMVVPAPRRFPFGFAPPVPADALEARP